MVTARTDAKLSALVGQDAFEVSAAAFAALARARCDIVETHRRLSEAKIQVGLRTIAWATMAEAAFARARWPPQGRRLTAVSGRDCRGSDCDERSGSPCEQDERSVGGRR